MCRCRSSTPISPYTVQSNGRGDTGELRYINIIIIRSHVTLLSSPIYSIQSIHEIVKSGEMSTTKRQLRQGSGNRVLAILFKL